MFIDQGFLTLFKKAQIDTSKLDEKQKASLFKEFADDGRAKKKNISEKDVDAKELAMGIEVEYEHTTDTETAKRIAMDHLAELKDYYTRLKKMEEEGKKEGAEVGENG